jgi:hypothetical protein
MDSVASQDTVEPHLMTQKDLEMQMNHPQQNDHVSDGIVVL